MVICGIVSNGIRRGMTSEAIHKGVKYARAFVTDTLETKASNKGHAFQSNSALVLFGKCWQP